MLRTLFRLASIFVLAIPAATEAQPAAPTPWIYRCKYERYREPSYVSATFRTQSLVSERVLADAWVTWLKTEKGVTGSASDARCSGTPDHALESIIDVVNVERRGGAPLGWMPTFGVAYALPREVYYYCVIWEQGSRRRFFTDVFRTPMPENLYEYLRKAETAHRIWLSSQRIDWSITNARCHPLSPEPFIGYAAALDSTTSHGRENGYTVVRSAWPGVDPVVAPDLINDLPTRARYAKKRVYAMIAAPTGATSKEAPRSGPTPPFNKPSLTLKTDTGPQDTGKAWDEQVKRTLAAEAQQRVDSAARTIQANAKAQADLAAFFRERRKRGRAQ